MDCAQRTPSHLVLHGDHFVEATKYQVEPVYPKTIDYKHTIRMLPAACDHENEIEKLTKKYQGALSEKDGEIQQLKRMLIEKENYGPIHVIQDKEGNTLQPQASFGRYLVPPEGSKCEFSRIQVNNQSSVTLSMNESNLSQRKTSDFLNIFPDQELEDSQQVLKVKREMKGTMDALSNITNCLNKPRTKYQFFNPCFEKETKELEDQNDKRLDETNFHPSELNRFSDPFGQSQECPTIVNYQYLEESDEDLDNTEEDSAAFLQDTLEEHEKLKQVLIELEQSTKREFEEMKSYYEQEILNYIEILSDEKEKDTKFHLNSTRSNISLQAELNPQQSKPEGNQENSVELKPQKFQIIFPEEDPLSPSRLLKE